MELQQFIASSAADAAQQIRARLGADAVVVNIRQVPGRWFQKSRIEVLAHATDPTGAPPGHVLDTTDEVTTATPQPSLPSGTSRGERVEVPPAVSVEGAGTPKKQGPAALLESLGLSPLSAARVLERMPATRPAWLADDLREVREALAATWIPCHPSAARLHVLVGAPGVGKTTALCKWLTLSVLLEGRSARVWRLDGGTANTAEALTVHGDVLGVPVERSWTGTRIDEDIAFVDLPGASGADGDGVCALVDGLGGPAAAQIHLVLNAAYDITASLAQVRAWAKLPIHDLIVTHLDEEPRWCKLWNLILGTGLPVRFLSAGQNIPSEFTEASAERVLSRVFPRI